MNDTQSYLCEYINKVLDFFVCIKDGFSFSCRG